MFVPAIKVAVSLDSNESHLPKFMAFYSLQYSFM
jgi:hypothetical protein